MKKPEVLVSSDIVGIWGNFDQLARIYAQSLPVLGEETIAIEMLGWKHLINQAKEKTNPLLSIRGIHGPVGGPEAAVSKLEKFKAAVFDQLMAGLEPVVKVRPELFQAGKSRNYLLVHEPELKRTGRIQTLVSMEYPGHILVENVLDVGSLEATVRQVKALQAEKVSAGIMIDLVHALKEYTQSLKTLHGLDQHTFDENWKKVLTNIYQVISQLPGSGLHIPVGVNGDSLPLEIMTKQHWQDLAQVIKSLGENLEWLTIENQPADFDLDVFLIREKTLLMLAERNYQITSMLAENEEI